MSGTARYAIPAAEHRVEQTIQRSRFIATIAPAASVDEASAFVRRVASEFADATHNCWAYVVGPPGSTDRVGMSDDGEPHNTAGRPMLNALVHGGLGDVAVVVTRYYGGTKLGTGGLVRAYGGTVQLALDAVARTERVEWHELDVEVDYASVRAVEALLPSFEAEALESDYGERVRFRVRLPAGAVDAFREAIGDATRGRGDVREVMRG